MELPKVVREKELLSAYGKVVKSRIFLDPDGRERDFLMWGGKKDGVIVFAVTPEKMVIAIPQFRRAANELMLEPAGGVINDSETEEQCAHRELLEETGYTAKRIVQLPKNWIDPPSCFTAMYPFVALNCTKTEKQNLEPTETMEMGKPILTDLAHWLAMIHLGQIRDFKTISVTFLSLPYIN